MDNETLKQLVLAKCEEIAPECGETYETKGGTILKDNDRQIGDHFTGWQIWDYRASSGVSAAFCDETPTDSHVWAIAADLLDIAQPLTMLDSQFRALSVALDLDAANFDQVLAEVKRLKAYEHDVKNATFL